MTIRNDRCTPEQRKTHRWLVTATRTRASESGGAWFVEWSV